MNAPTDLQGFAQALDVRLVVASALNPRKHFDADRHAELTESIRKHGILQPIIVRDVGNQYDAEGTAIGFMPEGGTGDDFQNARFEIVAGERRWRAAQAAGLQVVPVSVRTLSDLEALEIAVIENLQRSDLHPLEEAEGYERLAQSQLTVKEIADKIGKSREYVYARMKLCALCPEARTAFYDGALTASTALLVARIPSAQLQKQAIAELKRRASYNGEPASFRTAADIIHQRFMLALKDASFPPEDVELVATAGPCSACPKRSGSQPELFPDTKETDLCTDPDCFTAKREACTARQVKAAKAAGVPVATGKKARELQPHTWSPVKGHIKLDDRCPDDPKGRTYRKILGKDVPPPDMLLVHPDSGAVELVRVNDQLKKALIDKGVAGQLGKSPEERAKAAAEKLQTKIEEATRWRVWQSIREARARLMDAEASLTDDEKLAVFYRMFEAVAHDTQLVLARLWCWPASDTWPRWTEELAALAHVPDRIDSMLLDMTIAHRLKAAPVHTDDPLPVLATRYGVDMKLIGAAVNRELSPKAKAKAKPKAKGASKGKAIKEASDAAAESNS